MDAPYTPLRMSKWECIVFDGKPAWWAEYRNYLGQLGQVTVPGGVDELGTYINAMKAINKHKARADKRRQRK